MPGKTRYLSRMPKTVPEGRIVVHSIVKPTHPEQAPGVNGFRCWTQQPDDTVTICRCGWAPHLPQHYKPKPQ
jgi:hypothetical protein